ncbi:ferruginol synthase-like [Andrographis paniculata]|uniref:ferruginol synthase-like n=1 Tax=Andrographis paniculata TaxID=175694 RepID=UPI0021E73433|nr:ferruginol synthase-like [Andrographis paniculata]
MSLKARCCNIVVVSSPDVAKEMLTKHDRNISGRFVPVATEACDHNKYSFGLARPDPSGASAASQGLPGDKLMQLYEHVKDCASRGRPGAQGDPGWSVNTIFAPNMADYFPILKGTDLQCIKSRGEKSLGKILGILEDVIQKRLESISSNESSQKHYVLAALLDANNRKEYDISIDDIKHLIVLISQSVQSKPFYKNVIFPNLFHRTNRLGVPAHRKSVRLPPGPYPFPIIGNLFQIGRNPHRSLANLSKTYGPLMSLKIGFRNIVAVSSPEVAKEMLTKHDLAISGRFAPAASEACDHHMYCFGILPVGPFWRKCRKICRELLFSPAKLQASQGLRRDKLNQLYDHVKDCAARRRAVNIGEVVFTTTLNLMSATMFSFDLGEFNSVAAGELKKALDDVIDTVSAPNIADYFAILKGTDLQGLKRRGERSLGKILGILEDVIQKRLLESMSSQKHDFLAALLDANNRKEHDISIEEIKHLIMDLLMAGADPMSSTIVWGMTELLGNPEKAAKLKEELRTVIGEDKQVEESDISRLPYLQAVVKEVIRYHPPGPLLLPHKVEADIQVMGYTIPKDTIILINVWCIGRDSNIWSNPDSFEPERFLDSKIDFEGHHFEYLPFGSGRRICPGMPLAERMLHLVIAFFIHNFEWKLEEGQQLDFSDRFGVALHKRLPLIAVPSLRDIA